MVEGKVDKAVKSGELSNEEARSILKDARYNYKNQSYNKQMERRGAFRD
jgi:polyhydroxyalkanoate synthesis regulator phasin